MNHINADVEMQIVARDGAVTLLFSRVQSDTGVSVPALTDNYNMDAETAMRASVCLADMAFEADSSLKPIGPALKASMVEKHRSVLIPRFASVFNSLREKRTVTNDQLAVQMVDILCSEIFS